ncbi:uncharacterized protein LOC144918960 isoform X1 [Branchiostoma floridae x Branchiostoma belcheri]
MPQSNVLPLWGNDKTMNLNSLILTNIQSSPYFKNDLFQLKTYHEVIDEIYYKVQHLEPWEKGSRNTGGQTGMCGGVRGVGAGGIVSTAYCLLYKLFTLKLTRKQVNGLLQHGDSPYIRGLGFMYIRYTQPPADLWEWYEPYIDDDEELDVKAGTGCVMTVGEMLRSFLGKIEWFSTLFPRIPVPIQKDLEGKLASRPLLRKRPALPEEEEEAAEHIPDEEVSWGEAERRSRARRSRSSSRDAPKPASRTSSPAQKRRTDFERDLDRERDRQRREKERPRSRSSDRPRQRSRSREKKRSKSQEKHSPSKSRDSRRDRRRSRSRERSNRDRRRSRSRDKKHSRSQDRDGGRRDADRRSRERRHRSRSHDRAGSRHKDGGGGGRSAEYRDISSRKEKEGKKPRKDRESRERHRDRKRSRSRSKDRSSHKHSRGDDKRNTHHDNDIEEGQLEETVQNSS